MKMPFRILGWTLIVLTFMTISVPLLAQTRGTLSGTIQDPSGAVVPGVNVTIKNTQTGEEFTAITDASGVYRFLSIPLGTYALTGQQAGFKKFEVTGIVIQVALPAEANVKLEVGGVADQIVVTGEGQQVVNTITATLTNVINTRQVQDLPLPTRNPVDLARLQMGMAVTGDNTRTASVGGLRGSATNVTQDGINAMDNFVKTDSFFALSAPSLASTQEFSVTVGTVGSDMGRGVAQVRMVTKSGTNEFHGNVFYQHRNDFLEANSFFNNAVGTPRTIERQHWFGVAAGGPVFVPKVLDGRNKSFWFFSYEGFRENFMATRNRTVLTDLARKGTFRYTGSDGLMQSVDLLSIGNAHTLNPITMAQLNAMPASNNSLVGDGLNTGGWQYNVTGKDPSDKYVGRFDQELLQSQKFGYHKLEFVYNLADFLLTPDTFNSIEAPFPGGINAYQGSTRTLMAAAINSTFGTHMTNEARFGHQRAPVGFLREAPPGKPFFINLVSTTDYDNTFMAQGRNTLVYQFLDNFAYVRGSHTIRLGMDFQSVTAITYNDAGIEPTENMGTNSANSDGIVNAAFPSLPSGSKGNDIVTRARNIFADLTGFLGSASQTFNVASPTSGFVPGATRARNFKQRQFALYFQDEWRAKRNLTINYGLRWEVQAVPLETQGLAIQPTKGIDGLFGISGTGNLFNPGSLKGTAPTYLDFVNGDTGKMLYNNDWNNLAPFFGIAYQPRFKSGPMKWLFGSEGQSSIRAGYSISYLQDGFTVVSNALGTGTTNPGLIQSAANNTPTGVLTSSGVAITVPTFKMPISDADNILVNTNNGLWAFDPNLRVPYVQQWSFGIEKEVARGWVVEARYVANHAIKILRAFNINEVNIFENGFLTQFLNAQKNLALNGGSSFAPTCAGCIATPTLSTLFTGLSGSSGFSNSGFISNLNNNNVGNMANTLATSSTYRGTRPNLAPNFFMANPNANFARLLSNASYSNYNSLQTEVRKRMRHGLYLQANYTFAKALTDSEGSQSTAADYITLRNLKLDKHRSSSDQTHRFIANLIYELPFGTGRRFMASGFTPLRKVIEGWQVGSIITWQSGQPVSIFSGRTTFSYSANQPGLPAQLVGMTFQEFKDSVGVFKTPSGVFFIDPKLLNISTDPTTGRLTGAPLKDGILGTPAPGTLGNFPRYALNGPSFSTVDFSVTKRVLFTERSNFELKVNFLNAFNHTNFSFATTNFDNANFMRISSGRGSPRVINFILSINF